MVNDSEHQSEAMDPVVGKLLASLRPVPMRGSEAEQDSTNRFYSELDQVFDRSDAQNGMSEWWNKIFYPKKENIGMSTQLRKPAMAIMAGLLAIFVFLFGGMGITAYAAQASLPGDSLYGVKTSLEQVKIDLQADQGIQAQMYLELAQVRLNEIELLIQSGRFSDISQAVNAFTSHVQMALQSVNELASSDPQQAAEINVAISATLAKFANTLGSMLAAVPDPVKPQLDSAIVTVQTSTNDNSNDVNVNDANSNDDNSNEDNSNTDDGNSNDANANDDDVNANDDDVNANEDDANANDDNSNTSVEDNSNSNSNGNSNSDDSNGNSDDGSSDGSGSGGGDDSGGSGHGSGSGGSAWIMGWITSL